jgi:hypothetical protein
VKGIQEGAKDYSHGETWSSEGADQLASVMNIFSQFTVFHRVDAKVLVFTKGTLFPPFCKTIVTSLN